MGVVNDIKGVSWKWPLNQISQHNYTMEGTVGDYIVVKIYGTGYYDLGEFEGSPSIGHISISIKTGSFNADYITMDRYLSNGFLTKMPTSCDSNDLMYREAFYEWAEPDKMPFYIQFVESSGTRIGTANYELSYVPDDLLNEASTPTLACKTLE